MYFHNQANEKIQSVNRDKWKTGVPKFCCLEIIYFHEENGVQTLHRDIFSFLKCVCQLQGESAVWSSDKIFNFPKKLGKESPPFTFFNAV